jgi:dephospho-CoA kinase
MLQIGLTGGIGSGKTTVAKVFETLGIPVYYADEAGKRLLNENAELKQQIITQFGEESYNDGKLNRKHLASIVFNNKQKLEQLNSLVHPATIQDAQHWMKQQSTAYAIKEAALIFESGSGTGLNYIIGVYAPQALRIKRTIERDNITREEVMKRMENQLEEEMKMKLCDFIIYNDEQQLVIPQVLKLHQQFIKEASTT